MRLRDNDLYKEDLQRSIAHGETDFLCGKRVLITGGTGLIGSAIVDLLLRGNETLHTDTQIYFASRSKAVFEERYADEPLITWVPYDALRPLDFHEPVDFILHCAGTASPELYVSHAVETMLTNLRGINELLQYAMSLVNCKIVYISSSEVYGVKDTEDPFVENAFGYLDFLGDRAAYASAKRASETLCKAYCQEYGVHTCIARPGHIFGPTASEKDRRISSDFAYKAARGQKLGIKSMGNQIRSYMYCLDCARAILTVLERGKPAEAYNICGSEVASIRELAEMLAEEGGVSLSFGTPSEAEKRAFNPMNNSSLDCRKLYSLGFSSIFSIREGVAHTVSILRNISKTPITC